MDNDNHDFGEELRQLTRPKSLQKLKGELDYEDWVFTAQGKLEKAGLWDIISMPRPAGAVLGLCSVFALCLYYCALCSVCVCV